jgi:hypothetical protein
MRHTREETYEVALAKAQGDLRKLDPYETAYKAGCNYVAAAEGGQFSVPFFAVEYSVIAPAMSVRTGDGAERDMSTRLILLHYLIQADGTPPADRWVAFRELPDALGYDPAFQGRSSLRLAHEYGHDAKGFAAAAEGLGGEKLTFGDVSYMFRVLPRLRMAVILHLGDEEFGPAVNVLFDAVAGHYLPTEDLAVLGGLLASKLLKAR